MGKKYVERLDSSGVYKTYQEPVMSINEIRTMRDDEILFIYASKLPIKIKTTPYYKNYSLNSKTKLPPYKPYQKEQYEKMEYCDVNIKDEDEYDGDEYYEE